MSYPGTRLTGASATVAFATTTPLGAGGVYDSPLVVFSDGERSQVQTEVLADTDGTMLFRFYADDAGTDLIRSLTVPYTAADGYRQFGAPTFGQSVRYRFTDGGSGQSDFYFSTKVLRGAVSPQVLQLDGFVSPTMLASVQRSLLLGQTSQGTFSNVGVDQDQNLTVSIAQPTEAFGALIVSDLHPQIQRKWVAGLNGYTDETVDHDGGTVVASDGQLVLNTSATTSSVAEYISRQIGAYRPGQAVVCRFTMQFGSGAAATSQIIGVGDDEDGFFFGYDGATFGIMRRTAGQVEMRTLTVTGAPSSGGNVTITLNGGAVVVALAGTESIAETAAKIAAAAYGDAGGGWRVRYAGNQVVWYAIDTATRSGTYSFVDTGTTGATATGPAQTLAASASTDTWIAQTSWNGDPADGSQELPVLDFAFGQVAEIQYQWLGYGAIYFRLENPATGRYVTVHRIEYAGTAVVPSLRQPDLHLFARVDNLATTSDLTLRSGSMAMFVAGEPPQRQLGVRFSQSNTKSLTTTRTNIIVLRVLTAFKGATNRVRIFVDGLTFGNNSSNRTAEYHITVNPDLVGAPSWTAVDSNNSVVEYDVASTDIVSGTGDRIFTAVVGAVSGETRDLDEEHLIELDPGDIIVISGAQAGGGSAADLIAGCTWVEGV